MYSCDLHGMELESGQCCPKCVEFMKNAPSVETMTPQARYDEFYMWTMEMEHLSVPFSDLRERLKVLLGRPIYTHELGTKGIPYLLREINGTRKHPEFLDETMAHLSLEIRAKFRVLDMRDHEDGDVSLN